MRNDAVQRLFALFTSPDRAEAMAGDLIEERHGHGAIWFWMQVARVTTTLCRNIVVEAPTRMLTLLMTGAALLTMPAMAGAVSVGLFPHLLGSPMNAVTLSIFWWGGAFWVGTTLTTLDVRRGTVVCSLLALGVTAVSLLFAFNAGPELWEPLPLMGVVIGLAATVALMAGGAIGRRRAIALTAVLLLCASVSSATAQESEWRDPSPHTSRLITVDENVQLEVLNWGGSGPPLVLLAGLGATAHQYDDLAQTLTPQHRVIGITRRGHRGSSAVATGYTFDRLAGDIVRAMDASNVTNVVIIGHSFAGEEMHVLGTRYASRIRGLVYIDAAFNRGDDADDQAYGAVARTVPGPPPPVAGDLASFAALRRYLEKHGGAGPEGFLRSRFRVNADGTIAPWAPDLPVRQAMSSAIQAAYRSYHPAPVTVPALAIYAVPTSANDLIQYGSSDRLPVPELAARVSEDATLRGQVEQLYALTRARVSSHERWFSTLVPQARIVELSGTHDLIVSSPREVRAEIEAFLSSLPASR